MGSGGVDDSMRTAWISSISVGLVAVVLSLGTSFRARAGASVNPFAYIVERNPFGLRPPPPISDTPDVPVAPPPPLATVEVTGVLSVLSTPRALLEIVPGPGKPMIKPVLGVGERVDLVEVISIDIDKGEVVLRNGTVVTNIALKVAKSADPTPPPKSLPGLFRGRQVDRTPVPEDRRAVALGGGMPVPQRTVRVPQLPPAPSVSRRVPPRRDIQ